jgi:FixJ family two-component response regulator/anti-sigma regulatory factor (Ser/Thr protein kinase)
MEPQLRSMRVEITQNLPRRPVMVLADRLRLEQVIINLLRNALDAMKDNDKREIDLLIAEGDEAVLSVRDNGHGIEDLETLFEPFYTTKKPGEGVGLGLAISSGIVSDLGGRLTARNPDAGGAVFEIRCRFWRRGLPCPEAGRRPSNDDERDAAMKIAIVDDEQDMRQSISQWLALSGFETETYASAEDALKAIGADFPGVVVTDVKMPGMDGVTFLKRLMAQDSGLPVIMITGHGDVPMAVDAMRIGAFDFLEKPFNPDKMTELAKKASQQRRMTLDNRALRRELSDGKAVMKKLIGPRPRWSGCARTSSISARPTATC